MSKHPHLSGRTVSLAVSLAVSSAASSAASPAASRPSRFLSLCALSLGLVMATGCDNVGRAFDPTNGGGAPGSANQLQAAVTGGVSIDGRPRVRNVFPEGNGWPGTVPIVVVFSESISEASIAPQGEDENLFVRPKDSGDPVNNQDPLGGGGVGGGGGGGAPANIAVSVDLVLGSRVVILRPVTPFDTSEALTYEVVIRSELRDADGARFGGSTEQVIATFTPDKSDTVVDGEILTVLPVDNSSNQLREAPVFAIFTKSATQNSVTTGPGGNFTLRAGGVTLPGTVSFPIRVAGAGGGQDGRILRFEPDATLAASTPHEIVVADTILFPENGKLDFRGRTPFARFTTAAPGPVTAVKVGNPTPGTADKINANNIATLRIDVDVPADALVGDQVVARVYGLDKSGGTTGSLNFFEARSVVPASGAQTVGVSFAGLLGTAAAPNFLEGAATLGAYLQRGNETSGYVLSDAANNPALDVTPPDLATPAADAQGNRILYTDQASVIFYGTGAENLSSATLVLDSTPAPAPVTTTGVLFATGGGGRFMFRPINLGRRTSPLGFSLTISDSAGNESPPFTGTIVQRGVVTGTKAASGSLTVEAYDDATFETLIGATVVIEQGLPANPSVGRQSAVTGADGRATFTGLVPASPYSITVVAAGHDMVSLLGTSAGFVSLPARPTSGATATVRGTAAFTAGTGQSALIGCNILDDVRAEEISTSTTSPTVIPATDVRPNRPYILTAFGGGFEPTGVPTFVNAACSICGPTGIVKEAGLAPLPPGESGITTLAMLPSATTSRNLAAAYTKDLSTFPGLDPAKLVGTPTVRVMASLFGMSQMTLTGVGFAAKQGATTTYSINASYSASTVLIMADLGPKFWVSTEAEDSDGNLVRHRRIVLDPEFGTTLASGAVPGVSSITAPAGPSVDSPVVTYQDRMAASSIPSGLGFQVITATSAGRNWRIILGDTTPAAGATALQLPLLATIAVPTLAKGAWSVFMENHLVFGFGLGSDDYHLEEMRREEVTYARAPAVTFTVN